MLAVAYAAATMGLMAWNYLTGKPVQHHPLDCVQ